MLFRISVYIIGCVLMAMIPSTYSQTKKANMEVSVAKIIGAGHIDLYCNNGNQFFIVNNRLHILIWKLHNNQFETWIASTPLGKNQWQYKIVTGKGFYLGPLYSHQVCTVENTDETWRIQFFSLDGQFIKQHSHNYRKKNQEIDRYLPIPIQLGNRGHLFYFLYSHETENPISTFIKDLISGGHGGKTKISGTVELIPELFKGPESDKGMDNEPNYIITEIIDSTFRRYIFGGELSQSTNCQQTTINSNDQIKLTQNTCQETSARYTFKNNSVIQMTNQTINFYNHSGQLRISIKPPDYSLTSPLSKRVSSDILIDDQNNALYLISPQDSDPLLFYFDQQTKAWTTNQIDLEVKKPLKCQLFCHSDHVYAGFWTYPDEVTILKFNKNQLYQKGILTVPKLSHVSTLQ